MNTILDYGSSISLAAFTVAFAILLAAIAWKKTRKKAKEGKDREDRWLLAQIALFVLSGLVLMAFNLSNTNSSGYLPASVSNVWVFDLGIVLFVLAIVPLAPLSLITFYPESRLPSRIVGKMREGMQPASKAVLAAAVLFILLLNLTVLYSYYQFFLPLHSIPTPTIAIFIWTLSVSVVGSAILIVAFLPFPTPHPFPPHFVKNTVRFAIALFILPYFYMALLLGLRLLGIALP